MTRRITLGAAQTGSVEDGDLRTITESAHAMLDQAAREGVRLLTFGELFLTPFFANRLIEDFDRYFMHDTHEVLLSLRDKARQYGIALVLPFAERANDGYFNSAFVYDTDGREAGRYRKTHIPAYFPTEGAGGTGSFEKFYFTPGGKLETYAVAGTRIGVQSATTGSTRGVPRACPAGRRADRHADRVPTYADPAQRTSI